MKEIDFIESVKVLRLKPDDIIVLKISDQLLTPEYVDSTIKRVQPFFSNHKFLILDKGKDIEILRENNE